MRIFFKFIICGLSSSLLFPPFFILPIGFFVFPFLFFLLIDKDFQNKKKLFHFFSGLVFGISMNFMILIWIGEPFLINQNTKNYYFFSYILVIYSSIYYGLSFLILSYIRNNFSKLILFPILFVMSEILREYVGYGFPWITFASIHSSGNLIINLIYYLGTYGLSYVTIVVFLFPVLIILLKSKDNNIFLLRIYISIVIFFFLFSVILIFLRLEYEGNLKNKFLNITLAQLNFSLIDKINNKNLDRRYEEIVKVIDQNSSELLIFAENDYPYLLSNLEELKFIASDLTNNQSVIIGGTKKENSQFYNTFILIDKNKIQEFHKIILVPFGEFLPYRSFLGFFDKIIGKNDFISGNKIRLIETFDNLKITPVICYEIIFFNNLLSNYNKDSSILINITNDSWFGNFSGPYQHFYLARMRAIEFNKTLIRVSNNGISAVIDNKGKIIDYIPLNTKEIKSLKMPISFNSLPNLKKYHSYIYLLFFVLLILAIKFNKNEKI